MGKGGRCPETRAGRYARCEAPKPSWGSSDCGGTLESRVLRKAHARFGEGRMEKCSRSNSSAAYSTSITAARRGTSSRISPGSSCPSDCETGLTGSDRRDLVLQDAIYQFEHKQGVVAKVDADSAQLAAALNAGTPIIISTLQKFSFILKAVEEKSGRHYAVIVDEAHS